MDFSHVKDAAVALIAALLMWKLPALGVPIDQDTANKIALGALWFLGKLQKSPVPSLAPAPKPEIGSPHGGA